MEIPDSRPLIFYASRLFGLAPYLVKRNDKGVVIDYKLSVLLCIYSVFVLLCNALLTCRAILNDANSEVPIRMTTSTSKFVTTFDVFAVVVTCSIGVGCGLFASKRTNIINQRLKEADDILASYTDKNRDKRREVVMLVSVLFGISLIIGLDLGSRQLKSYKLIAEFGDADTINSTTNAYIPFYILYFIVMAIQMQFAQTALGIGRRYRRLNIALQAAFPKGEETVRRNSVHMIRVPSINLQTSQTSKLTHHHHHPTSPAESQQATTLVTSEIVTQKKVITSVANVPDLFLSRKNYLVERLAYTHTCLGEAVGNVSSAFGVTLLSLLASCLLHLVATAYFLFVEILGENDTFISVLQFLWLFFHSCRLLLIVEPCHITSREAKRTIILVSEILRNCKDAEATRNLKKFWRQLLADRTYFFSACGMCDIDRQILTSISGAIATYLVILIQFQKTDG